MNPQIDYFKTKEKDITIQWESQRQLPMGVINEKLYAGFPSFNIEILDENQNFLFNYDNIPSSENFGSISKSSIEARLEIIKNNPGFIWANPRKKEEFFKNKDIVKNSFTFSIEENYRIFREKNNIDGYYKNIYIKITHNDTFQISYICQVEYEEINLNILENSIKKIYRSSDNLSLKLKLNPEEYLNSNTKSLVIFSKINNEIILKPIFIEDIENKWLNTVDTSKILTIPFEETEILEEGNVLNVEIFPIESSKNLIIKNLIDQKDKLELFLNTFSSNKIISKNLYRYGSILEAVNFQGYAYLFSNESYQNISWPQNDIIINNIAYNKYFTKAKDNLNQDTFCLNNQFESQTNLVDITLDPNISDVVGYYNLNKDTFYDIKSDLPYFKSLNINKIKVVDIQKRNNEYSMFIEFITNLTDKDDIVISYISSDLNFVQKSYQLINNINYLTLLFSIKYDYVENENINNLIYNKIMINFSFKYNSLLS